MLNEIILIREYKCNVASTVSHLVDQSLDALAYKFLQSYLVIKDEFLDEPRSSTLE